MSKLRITKGGRRRLVPVWIKTWCCQYDAVRFGDELRCKGCGNLVYDDYWKQKLIIEGEPFDAAEMVEIELTK